MGYDLSTARAAAAIQEPTMTTTTTHAATCGTLDAKGINNCTTCVTEWETLETAIDADHAARAWAAKRNAQFLDECHAAVVAVAAGLGMLPAAYFAIFGDEDAPSCIGLTPRG
jgi:hypothetical protein